MSSAYGHLILPMSQLVDGKPLASAYREARWIEEHRYESTGHVTPAHWRPNCSGRNCPEKPMYASRYLYVTGRAGRVTDRIQYWCPACGQKWAQRHNTPFEPAQQEAAANG